MNGSYLGYSFNDDKPHSDRKYIVKYSFWNLLRFSNYLTILQQSPADKYGNWKSRIMISTNNPLVATGNFTYETGKYTKAWGLHNICINLDAKIINIEVVEKHNTGVIKYYIKKK